MSLAPQPNASRFAVGIDLGTACSALARIDDLGRSAMLRNPQGDLLVPSLVFFEEDELVFGQAAGQAAAIAPQRVAEGIKPALGAASRQAIGSDSLPVPLIAGCLLKKLAGDVSDSRHAPAAVVALPASAGDFSRASLVDACQIAGLELLGTVSEPVAAALAFAEQHGYLKEYPGPLPDCRVLVFDLGAGKLDVAVAQIQPRMVRLLACGSDVSLGGQAWDQRLADAMAAQYQQQFDQDPRADAVHDRRLRQTAEETRHTLSVRQQARVHVDRAGIAAEILIERVVFEALTTDLVGRARGVTLEVLARAGVPDMPLTHLLLVGGASRMPLIGAMLEGLTGLKTTVGIHPDEAVARGAALAAEWRLARVQQRPSRIALVDFPFEPTQPLTVEAGGDSLAVEEISAWRELLRGSVGLRAIRDRLPREASQPVAEPAPPVSVQLAHSMPMGAPLPSAAIENAWQLAPVSAVAPLPGSVMLDVQQPAAPLSEATLLGEGVRMEATPGGGLVDAGVPSGLQPLQPAPGPSGGTTPLGEVAPLNVAQPAMTPLSSTVALTATAPLSATGAAAEAAAMANAGSESWSPPMEKARRIRGQRSLKFHLLNAAGFILFSVLGLAIGYYIFVTIRPEFNTWNLPLPGGR